MIKRWKRFAFFESAINLIVFCKLQIRSFQAELCYLEKFSGMTIIEVPNSAQQNTRDAKSEEEMMPPTVSSPPPPSVDSGKKRVTFEVSRLKFGFLNKMFQAPAPTQNELAYCARVTEILPEIPQVRILQALRVRILCVKIFSKFDRRSRVIDGRISRTLSVNLWMLCSIHQR